MTSSQKRDKNIKKNESKEKLYTSKEKIVNIRDTVRVWIIQVDNLNKGYQN
jgi:hypothetical protein